MDAKTADEMVKQLIEIAQQLKQLNVNIANVNKHMATIAAKPSK